MPSNRRKPDVVTSFPNYDLHRAAAAGNLGLVQYALTQGQPVNSVLAGVLPIHAAASGGFEPVVRMLLDAGADVNAPRLSSKMGPPSNVAGIAEMVGPSSGRSSSAQGPRPGSSGTSTCPTSQPAPTIGNRGSTPLHFAAAMGHVSIVKLLLERGADPSLRDTNKLRPIDEAKAQGRQKIVQLLEAWEAIKAFPLTDRPATTPTLTHHEPSPWSDNGSTTSLPVLPSATANGSTSSLGRHSVAPRRPSLPSIKETSPPSTSPQAIRPKPNTSVSEPRRPKSAGSGTSGASNERKWSSPTSRGAGIQPSTQSLSFTKLLRKTPFRPSSASAAESQISSSASHPSRQPFISKIVERAHCHEPQQGITVDVISGPLSTSQGPSHSIQDDVRPDLAAGIAQLSAVELHYATQNLRVPQTAPPTQANFSVSTRVTDSRGRSPSRPDTNPGLTVPRHRMGLTGMHGADPHQLGPEGPRSRIDSEATLLSTTSGSSGINTDEYQVEQRDRSPHPKGNSHLSPHSARPRQVSGNGSERSPNRPRGESLSSMVSDATSNSNATSKDSELSSAVRTPHSAAPPDSVVNKDGLESASLSTNETRKANSLIIQEDAEDLKSPAIDSPTKQKRRSKRLGSTPVSPISGPPQSPLVGLGISGNDFPTDIRLTTHAEVREMRVAQMRAIEEGHEKETTRRRAASASADQPPGMAPLMPIEETLDTSPTQLRQQLAALGHILQLERRFALGEKQAAHWNKPREEDGGSDSGHVYGGESMSAYSVPLSVRIRNDQLSKASDPDLEEERTRKPIATKLDVFGQPIKAKEKERRPSTPKDARPSTAPKTTQSAPRVLDAPRENRILPPAEKTVRIANPSMLTPPHVPHRARSEHSLPQVNRDEIAGRDRAWTTTDVRPRLGPVASNPKLTIELATPTDRSDPLWPSSDFGLDQSKEPSILEEQSESPTMVSVLEATGMKGNEEQKISQETRTSRKPLKIRRPRTAPMFSTTPVDPLATESLGPFTSDSKVVSTPIISHAEPPPSTAPSRPQKENPPSSFYQTVTPLTTGNVGVPLTRIVTEPFDTHRTPVELHNLLAVQSREERRTGKGDSPNRKNQKESTMSRAVEKRLGIGAGGQVSGFGHQSVLSLETEKPINPFHIPIPGDETSSPEPSKSKGPKKIVGFFSRLKK